MKVFFHTNVFVLFKSGTSLMDRDQMSAVCVLCVRVCWGGGVQEPQWRAAALTG